MIDEKIKIALNELGEKIGLTVPGFYGKIVFNFHNGNYVSFNVELTVKKDNLYERNKK